MRLSCAEIRRLFWQLVLQVERKVEAVLDWSWWRRRHQMVARGHHYQRRAERTPAAVCPTASGPSLPAEPERPALDNLVEQVWRRLEPLLPSGKRNGRPYSWERRLILEAIVHQMRTGCGWNALPEQFPPYQTVHTQLREWQKSGLWAKIWEGLEQPQPLKQLQL